MSRTECFFSTLSFNVYDLFLILGYYPYNPYAPLNYANGSFASPGGGPPSSVTPNFLGNPGGPVPTGKLVDLSGTNTPLLPLHQNTTANNTCIAITASTILKTTIAIITMFHRICELI